MGSALKMIRRGTSACCLTVRENIMVYDAFCCNYRSLLIHLVYKDECLFVCLYLIQIHISEPIGTKLRTQLSLGLEETVGYV
jgi:hypothetical protein